MIELRKTKLADLRMYAHTHLVATDNMPEISLSSTSSSLFIFEVNPTLRPILSVSRCSA
jgi:hypothetical protein